MRNVFNLHASDKNSIQRPITLNQYKNNNNNGLGLFYKLPENIKQNVNYYPQNSPYNNEYSLQPPPIVHQNGYPLENNYFVRRKSQKIESTENKIFHTEKSVKEPIPHRYKTFQIYEPMPGQILIPPSPIPLFRPVPLHLKAMPVLEKLINYPTTQPSYRFPISPPRMQPFYAHEAMSTSMPQRAFVPATKSTLQFSTIPYQVNKPNVIDTYHQKLRVLTSNVVASPSSKPIKSSNNTHATHSVYPHVVYAVTSSTNDLSSTTPNSVAFDRRNTDPISKAANKCCKNVSNNNTNNNKNITFDTTNSKRQTRPHFNNELDRDVNRPPLPIADQLVGHTNHLNVNAKHSGIQKLDEFRIIVNSEETKDSQIGYKFEQPNQKLTEQEWLNYMTQSPPTVDQIQPGVIKETVVYGKHQVNTPVNPPSRFLVQKTLQVSPSYSRSKLHRYIPRPATTSSSTTTQSPYLENSSELNELGKQINRLFQSDLPTTQTPATVTPIRPPKHNYKVDEIQIESIPSNHKYEVTENYLDEPEFSIQSINTLDRSDLNGIDDKSQNQNDSHIFLDIENTKEKNLTNEFKNNNKKSNNNNNDINSKNNNSTANNINAINDNTEREQKYFEWFSQYAAEKKKKYGHAIISEHFKRVEIEPNVAWVMLPR